MMTDYDSIKALRSQERYQEAYDMCIRLKSEQPDIQWVHTQLGWSLYGMLKSTAVVSHAEDFLSSLQELADLNKERPIDQFIINALVWPIRQFASNCIRDNMVDENLLYRVFAIMQQINFNPQDENYGILLGAFVKAKTWGGLKTFIEWWNLDNIKEKDCEPFKMDNGRTVMSVAEQAYIAYSRILLAEVESRTVDTDKALAYASRLGDVAANHPEFQYPGYFKAKLLMSIGHNEDAQTALIPFIKKHSSLYWVWDLMGDVQSDIELRLSCYCKALTCPVKDSFLRKLHFKLCDILLKKEMYNEAASELRMAIDVSINNGWGVPYKYQDYTIEQWYKQADNTGDNRDFYKRNTRRAEQLAYADYPQTAIVVVKINKERHVANFVTADHKKGFFSCKPFRFKVGNTYICRMENDEGDHYKVHTCEPANNGEELGLTKWFSGTLTIKQTGFGFVGDVFVHASLAKEYENGMTVSGVAIPSFDERKGRWGWSALRLKNCSDESK